MSTSREHKSSAGGLQINELPAIIFAIATCMADRKFMFVIACFCPTERSNSANRITKAQKSQGGTDARQATAVSPHGPDTVKQG